MPESIAVCICTCSRPLGLKRLLRALNQLSCNPDALSIRVIVVDNDVNGSARITCADGRPELRWPLEYVHEPKRGISFARNAALDAASNSDWICFLDDDEAPSECWLTELLRVQKATGEKVVAGPVLPEFIVPPEQWVIQGGFFAHPEIETGRILSRAFTGNVLLSSEMLKNTGIRFDERLALSGGEDSLFFRHLVREGVVVVWARSAIVYEFIPPERTTSAWLIARKYRIGANMSRIALILTPGIKTAISLLLKSPIWLLIGATTWIAGLLWGRHLRIRGRQWMAYARGLVSGVRGRSVDSYLDIDGS